MNGGSMKYTINTFAALPVKVESFAGRVVINGLSLLPHEAAMVGDALNDCAESAEDLAAQAAGDLKPVGAA